MLLFEAYRKGEPLEGIDLSGCYLYGLDHVPLQVDIAADKNKIWCNTTASAAYALAIPWYAGSAGAYLLNTNRLPERSRPYNLNLELARGQFARLYRKREDWGLFDDPDASDIEEDFHKLKDKLVEALIVDITDPGQGARVADESLDEAITLGERMTLYHSNAVRNKRLKKEGGILLGSNTNILASPDNFNPRVVETPDFISIPMRWKDIEQTERNYNFDAVSRWTNWAHRHNKPIFAGPLICLDKTNLPDWAPLWKDDFETLRILILTHAQRLLEHYGDIVDYWTVVSGLSINNFDLEFDQIMDLTKTVCQLVKKNAPKAQALIEIPMPWGEYYARNQRSIPPTLYADLVAQNDVKFNGFAIPLQMGKAIDGYYVRDIMQISDMIDWFTPFDKDIHLINCQVPSCAKMSSEEAGTQKPIMHAGMWHNPWGETLQAEWLNVISQIAMSKPQVKSLCWGELIDSKGMSIYRGGLMKDYMTPKESMKELSRLIKTLSVPQPTDGPAPDNKPISPLDALVKDQQ